MDSRLCRQARRLRETYLHMGEKRYIWLVSRLANSSIY